MPNKYFGCQRHWKVARFVFFGTQSAKLTTLRGDPPLASFVHRLDKAGKRPMFNPRAIFSCLEYFHNGERVLGNRARAEVCSTEHIQIRVHFIRFLSFFSPGFQVWALAAKCWMNGFQRNAFKTKKLGICFQKMIKSTWVEKLRDSKCPMPVMRDFPGLLFQWWPNSLTLNTAYNKTRGL